MTACRLRASRWLAMVVTVGVLAMHGAAGEHGASGMGMPAAVGTAAALPLPAAMHGVDMGVARQPALAAASTSGHAGQLCVALPVLLWLLVATTATFVRRRGAMTACRSRIGVRPARAPPCPPPQARGVCLT